MNPILLQLSAPLMISSFMGIMIHETQLDSAISAVVFTKNNTSISTEIIARSPHTHHHDNSMLEHLRSLSSSRSNAKRNKGENEKKYLIQKRNSGRTLSSDSTLWPSE